MSNVHLRVIGQGSLGTDGQRRRPYPADVSGRFVRARRIVYALLIALWVALPWIPVNGHPAVFLDIEKRQFFLFGLTFNAQDAWLLFFALSGVGFGLVYATALLGRVWCGWACPQTLFMEMVFRKIEYWIEGDANEQRRLKQAPWYGKKIAKKGLKHLVFMGISILIAHTAMAYLISIDQVKEIVTQNPSEHLAGFIGLFVFTGIFYSNFAFFREQACIAVCPYGRLQSVLLVKDSIVVAYDWLRGEPRGKIKKNTLEIEKRGDCIDCKLCVHVCPTGIDIRNGTQLECVNCTVCIDACDEVMVKINKPKGLIRYSSYNAIKNGVQKLFTPRIAGYSVVLTLLISLLGYFIFTRADVQVTILKAPGTLYTKTDDGHITNLYQVELVNKTFEDLPLELKIESPSTASIMKVGEANLIIPKEGMMKRMYLVQIPENEIKEMKTIIELGIYAEGKRISHTKAKFVGPLPKRKN